MGGEAWSCFAHLPVGLIDPRSASLTLNWLRPKPTLAGFMLTRGDVDADKYQRNLRIQRQALFAGTFLIAGVASLVAADRLMARGFLDSDMAVFATVWVATSGMFLSVFAYVFTMMAAMRYRRAEPRRIAFNAACEEFEQIEAWRSARCEPKFWCERLDDAGFKVEAAELLAGHLKTGQVMVTRAADDYGVDVLICSPAGRIVAQCKRWKGARIGALQVRALAGARAFFAADRAILMSMERPSEDREQCESFAASQRLEFWNLDAIVAAAVQLRNGSGA